MPRVGALVHGVEVERRLELRLASREEHDAGDGRGHAAAQELEGVVGDLEKVGREEQAEREREVGWKKGEEE